MFQKLVSHNDDIRRLVEKGYAVAFDSNCLIIRDIPYLDTNRQEQFGAIVAKLVFVDQVKIIQDDHQIYFAGDVPHGLNGLPIPNLGGGQTTLTLTDACADVIVQRSFSNKPRATGKFQDFFEKIESYVSIISGPAIELFNSTPYTFTIVEEVASDSVFKFHDTLTSRAEIIDLSSKVKDDIIAIIGLGGTGAYTLDFMVKTPVKEIRGFDSDYYHVHTAFRSPGELNVDDLGKKKAEVYHSRYENFRTGITLTSKFIDTSCQDDLSGVTFAFVCVDNGTSRAGIFELLTSMSIPFIDVGMGLNRNQSAINGMLRMTYYPTVKAQGLLEKNLAPRTDNPDDIYKTNIQISELNALNACFAVIRFKQLRGFYHDEITNYHQLFGISDLKIVESEEFDED